MMNLEQPICDRFEQELILNILFMSTIIKPRKKRLKKNWIITNNFLAHC